MHRLRRRQGKTEANTMSLVAIKYDAKAHELQLLDQRLLPFKHEYMPIPDAAAGWSAIREMAVRGAPAIAIAGVRHASPSATPASEEVKMRA